MRGTAAPGGPADRGRSGATAASSLLVATPEVKRQRRDALEFLMENFSPPKSRPRSLERESGIQVSRRHAQSPEVLSAPGVQDAAGARVPAEAGTSARRRPGEDGAQERAGAPGRPEVGLLAGGGGRQARGRAGGSRRGVWGRRATRDCARGGDALPEFRPNHKQARRETSS